MSEMSSRYDAKTTGNDNRTIEARINRLLNVFKVLWQNETMSTAGLTGMEWVCLKVRKLKFQNTKNDGIFKYIHSKTMTNMVCGRQNTIEYP